MSLLNKLIVIVAVLISLVILSGVIFGSYYFLKDDNGENKIVITDSKIEETLQAAGINPEDLPAKISKEMDDCFVEKLGIDRIRELSIGPTEPSQDDYNKIKDCIK